MPAGAGCGGNVDAGVGVVERKGRAHVLPAIWLAGVTSECVGPTLPAHCLNAINQTKRPQNCKAAFVRVYFLRWVQCLVGHHSRTTRKPLV
jgi:hypothetical protein